MSTRENIFDLFTITLWRDFELEEWTLDYSECSKGNYDDSFGYLKYVLRSIKEFEVKMLRKI